MPVRGNGVRVGSVPLDALDAEQLADLLSQAAQVIGALVGDESVERLNAELAGAECTLTELHVELALALADLDEAIEAHTGIILPP